MRRLPIPPSRPDVPASGRLVRLSGLAGLFPFLPIIPSEFKIFPRILGPGWSADWDGAGNERRPQRAVFEATHGSAPPPNTRE
jgi:hypothetical protein